MKVSEYLDIAHRTDRLSADDEFSPRLGLAGEVGSLLTVLKKEVRSDRPTAEATRETVNDELGDIIWYIATIARRAQINLQKDVLFGNLKRIRDNYAEGNLPPAPLLKKVVERGGEIDDSIRKGPKAVNTFGKYQKLAVRTSKYKKRKALKPYLVQVWDNVGELLKPHSPYTSDKDLDDKENVANALGDIMWYVAGFAQVYDLQLDEVVRANMDKIKSAFPDPKQRINTPLYDQNFEALERFPRFFRVDFLPQGTNVAVMLINGVRVGDPLTDNAYTSTSDGRELIDGYRFHDSIHLAFVAVLGWSPVMRSLLMRKRKSDNEIDEVEDGARARIVEEMIVKKAHAHAMGHHPDKLFDDKDYINLNFLKDLQALAEGLEITGAREGFSACKFWEWEKALITGFRIYNELRREKRGRIEVDLKKREVKFVSLSDKEAKAAA